MPHVTFVHGIANKPPKEKLLENWEAALAQGGLDLGSEGVTTSMVYWADVMYAEPETPENSVESAGEVFGIVDEDEDLEWVNSLPDNEKAFVDSFRERLNFDAEPKENKHHQATVAIQHGVNSPSFEAIPLPNFIKRRLMKRFLKDVHHYLFNSPFSPRMGENFQVQSHIRNLFINQLKQDAQDNEGAHVIVSHSMGTVISYDCLKNVAECPRIDGYMTVGSPLGLSEVHKNLSPPLDKYNGFLSETLSGSWINIYDRFDPVALDASLANDYQKSGQSIVTDIEVTNSGAWRHTGEKYYQQKILVDQLATLLQL